MSLVFHNINPFYTIHEVEVKGVEVHIIEWKKNVPNLTLTIPITAIYVHTYTLVSEYNAGNCI